MESNAPIKASVYWNGPNQNFTIKYPGWPAQYADTLWMEECDFVVWESGRQKVIRTGRHTPHAFIKGYVLLEKPNWPREAQRELGEITYNPYKDYGFMISIKNNLCRVKFIQYVAIHDKKVFRCC